MKDQPQVSVGIFSVSKDQWEQFLAMMDDSGDNFSTWEQWKIQIDQVLADMTMKGVEVVEVEVDLDDFSAWCDANGRARDGSSRSLYASQLLQK